jgi:hypothetical protein
VIGRWLRGLVLTYMQMVDGSSWSSAIISQIDLGILNEFLRDFFLVGFFLPELNIVH